MADPLALFNSVLTSQDPALRQQFSNAIIEQPAGSLVTCPNSRRSVHSAKIQLWEPFARPSSATSKASTPTPAYGSSETSLKSLSAGLRWPRNRNLPVRPFCFVQVFLLKGERLAVALQSLDHLLPLLQDSNFAFRKTAAQVLSSAYPLIFKHWYARLSVTACQPKLSLHTAARHPEM